jgi:hypothetical protein
MGRVVANKVEVLLLACGCDVDKVRNLLSEKERLTSREVVWVLDRVDVNETEAKESRFVMKEVRDSLLCGQSRKMSHIYHSHRRGFNG